MVWNFLLYFFVEFVLLYPVADFVLQLLLQ